MKTAHILIALALAALLSTSASAQERRRDARDDDERPNREKLLERFDTNQDGRLDQQERDALRKAIGQQGDRRKPHDGGQGTPPRKGGERPMSADFLKRFDKNKDGKLDEAERATARKALAQRGDKSRRDDKRRSGDDEQGTSPARRGERPIPPEFLKRFDKNKDGKLDEAERTTARKALAQRGVKSRRGDKRRSGDDGQGTPPARRGERPIPPEFLKRFDKDKDGKLDEAERTAARKVLGQPGDKRRPGDGEHGTPPRRPGERPLLSEILKRFDKDKDGKLDEAERATAREARAQRHGHDRGGERRRRAARGDGRGGDGARPPQRRHHGDDGPPRGGRHKGNDR